ASTECLGSISTASDLYGGPDLSIDCASTERLTFLSTASGLYGVPDLYIDCASTECLASLVSDLSLGSLSFFLRLASSSIELSLAICQVSDCEIGTHTVCLKFDSMEAPSSSARRRRRAKRTRENLWTKASGE
ncbi:hypothetical protein FOL47_004528, partial [Perkinsus chesapeaki]